MKAKEKANKIYSDIEDKFLEFTYGSLEDYMDKDKTIKGIANILIDEIETEISFFMDVPTRVTINRVNFWNDVKKEIELI